MLDNRYKWQQNSKISAEDVLLDESKPLFSNIQRPQITRPLGPSSFILVQATLGNNGKNLTVQPPNYKLLRISQLRKATLRLRGIFLQDNLEGEQGFGVASSWKGYRLTSSNTPFTFSSIKDIVRSIGSIVLMCMHRIWLDVFRGRVKHGFRRLDWTCVS
jgi:hypothetical protein